MQANVERGQAFERFTYQLLEWHKSNGRHQLPWQKTDNWYTRLLSEVMLQQTQVATVIPYFERFIAHYPDAQSLAAAPDEEVMALWAGLGYYSRCRNLLRAVREIVFERHSEVPSSAAEWAQLPGVGLSTAGAIASFVTSERAVMCDGNAKRSLSRVFGVEGYPGEKTFESTLWEIAGQLLPESADMPAYTQALMDFGALLCKRKPLCERCPMSEFCFAFRCGRTAEIPGRKPRRERPVRYATARFMFSADSVWLQKRSEKGVWKDLWVPAFSDFTLHDAEEGPRTGVASEDVLSETRWADFVHDFTHFRLIVHPVLVELRAGAVPEGMTAVSLDAPWPALPAPVKTLLTQMSLWRNQR